MNAKIIEIIRTESGKIKEYILQDLNMKNTIALTGSQIKERLNKDLVLINAKLNAQNAILVDTNYQDGRLTYQRKESSRPLAYVKIRVL